MSRDCAIALQPEGQRDCQKKKQKPDATLEGPGMRITLGQEFETSLTIMMKPTSTKNTKISQVWWQAPVIQATQKSEAGELPEPRRWRLQ